MMTDSPIKTPEWRGMWLSALHGNGSGQPQPDAYESIRCLAGGLYDTICRVFTPLQPASLLDLGAGDGSFTRAAVLGLRNLQCLKRVRLTDLNLPLIQNGVMTRLQQAHPAIIFDGQFMDLNQAWVMEGQWDLITCSSVVMFLKDEQIPVLLGSVRACMRMPHQRFWLSTLSWNQGVGTYRRKKERGAAVLRSAEPDDACPAPFCFSKLDVERMPWPEHFRPREWWREQFSAAGFAVAEEHVMRVPEGEEVSRLRPEKFPAGADIYDAWLLNVPG